MKVRLALIICVLCAGAASACEGLFIVISPNGVLVVNVDPPVVPRQPNMSDGCSASSPASAAFQLVIREPGEDLSLRSITFRFADGTTPGSRPVMFSAAEITRMFGSSVVMAGAARRLGFSVPYDCSLPRPTRMFVHVDAATRSGRAIESEAAASIQE